MTDRTKKIRNLTLSANVVYSDKKSEKKGESRDHICITFFSLISGVTYKF